MAVVMLLIVFWIMQVSANVLFKMGGDAPARWWWCFLAGNAVGVCSIFFLMKLYARLDAHLAMALAGGGSFLAVQVGLALVFGGRPSWLQWVAFVMITAGMALGAWAGRPAKPETKPVEQTRLVDRDRGLAPEASAEVK